MSLFMIFAVLDVLLHVAVNVCINCSFVHLLRLITVLDAWTNARPNGPMKWHLVKTVGLFPLRLRCAAIVRDSER